MARNVRSASRPSARVLATVLLVVAAALGPGAPPAAASHREIEQAALQVFPPAALESTFSGVGDFVAIDGDRALVSFESGLGDSLGVFRWAGCSWELEHKAPAPDAASGLAIDGDTALLGGRNSSEAYVYTRSGSAWSQVTTMRPSGTGVNTYGVSVALDGDLAVVGAHGDRNGAGVDTGAAYVFRRAEGDAWSQVAILTPADGGAGDFFGLSVAVDGSTVVVGSPYHAGTGAAYVFTAVGDAWLPGAKLTGLDLGQGDYFGVSVDVDAMTIVVGAHGHDRAPYPFIDYGAAYVFQGAGVWAPSAVLTASDGQAQDFFGLSVALDGATILVGAPGDLPGGSAYVFAGGGAAWAQRRKLVADASGDFFGRSAALAENLAVVGASAADRAYIYGPDADGDRVGDRVRDYPCDSDPLHDSVDGAVQTVTDAVNETVGTATGAVDSVKRQVEETATTLPQAVDETVTTISDTANQTVAMVTGTVDSVKRQVEDTVTTLPDTVTTLRDTVTTLPDAVGPTVTTVVDAAEALERQLEETVDNLPQTIAEAVDAVQREVEEAVVRLDRQATDLANPIQRQWPRPEGIEGKLVRCCEYGRYVAVDGDAALAGWNVPDVWEWSYTLGWHIVSNLSTAPGSSIPGGANSFAVAGKTAFVTSVATANGVTRPFVSTFSPNEEDVWAQVFQFSPDPAPAGQIAWVSAAIDGDLAVVGVAIEDQPGVAYVFARNPGSPTWWQAATLTPATRTPGDDFGFDVAIDDDTVVVGAPSGGGGRGSSHLFSRSLNGWSETAAWTGAATGDGFGVSVDVHGATVVVGAPGHDAQGKADAGAAYAFVRLGPNQWLDPVTLMALGPQAGDRFGIDVGVDGDAALVGAPFYGSAGAVLVFSGLGSPELRAAKSALTQGMIAAVQHPTAQIAGEYAGDEFGISVAASRSWAIAGAPGHNPTGLSPRGGSAYIFGPDVDDSGYSDRADLLLLVLWDGDGDGMPDRLEP